LVGTPLLQKEGKVLNYTYLAFSSFGRRSTPDDTVRGEVVSFTTASFSLIWHPRFRGVIYFNIFHTFEDINFNNKNIIVKLNIHL
jgi:hypothetical protein